MFFFLIFIGFVYYVCLLFIGFVSGGMINVARSFVFACAGFICIKGCVVFGVVVFMKIFWDCYWIVWVVFMVGGVVVIVVDFFMIGFSEKKNIEAFYWFDAIV